MMVNNQNHMLILWDIAIGTDNHFNGNTCLEKNIVNFLWQKSWLTKTKKTCELSALSCRFFIWRIQICSKKGISPIILFWGWDWDHQSYSREGYGFLGHSHFCSESWHLHGLSKDILPPGRCKLVHGLSHARGWRDWIDKGDVTWGENTSQHKLSGLYYDPFDPCMVYPHLVNLYA